MKFINLINGKFYELNNKFEQYIYKPNTQIYEEKIYEKFKHDSRDESKNSDGDESEENEEIYCDCDEFYENMKYEFYNMD